MSLAALSFIITEWATGIEPRQMWDGLAPGTWLIFGIILVPVYAMILGWFIGKPSDPKKGAMGLVYLVALILGLWLPALVGTILIGIIFF